LGVLVKSIHNKENIKEKRVWNRIYQEFPQNKIYQLFLWLDTKNIIKVNKMIYNILNLTAKIFYNSIPYLIIYILMFYLSQLKFGFKKK